MKYFLYGLTLDCPFPLNAPASGKKPEVVIRANPSLFRKIRPQVPLGGKIFQYSRLPDGKEYLRFHRFAEFLITPGGGRLFYKTFPKNPKLREAFLQHLLVQAVSFAMIRQGREPFHATALVSGKTALALFGDSGFGKSTLASCLISRGFRLLSDDLLNLAKKNGRWMAFPGSPRIKLYDRSAKRFFRSAGEFPVNPRSGKRIIRLPEEQVSSKPAQLAAIYLLSDLKKIRAKKTVALRKVKGKDAVMETINAFYNLAAENPQRNSRHLEMAHDMAASIPIRKIYYPRSLKHLPRLAQLIEKDLSRIRVPVPTSGRVRRKT